MTEWLLGRIKLEYLSECRTNSLRTWKKDTADRKGPYQSTRNRMAEVPSSSLDLVWTYELAWLHQTGFLALLLSCEG